MPRIVADRSDTLTRLGGVFREYGYEGATITRITKATGLGKGSLYHLFPGGKEEMVAAVLDEIDSWFDSHVFSVLRSPAPPRDGISAMFKAVVAYFRSGRRVCLVGVLALGDTRDVFACAVRNYFTRWVAALADALVRSGWDTTAATALAEEIVAGIQGAIVLTRALDDPTVFTRTIARLRARLITPTRRQRRAR